MGFWKEERSEATDPKRSHRLAIDKHLVPLSLLPSYSCKTRDQAIKLLSGDGDLQGGSLGEDGNRLGGDLDEDLLARAAEVGALLGRAESVDIRPSGEIKLVGVDEDGDSVFATLEDLLQIPKRFGVLDLDTSLDPLRSPVDEVPLEPKDSTGVIVTVISAEEEEEEGEKKETRELTE